MKAALINPFWYAPFYFYRISWIQLQFVFYYALGPSHQLHERYYNASAMHGRIWPILDDLRLPADGPTALPVLIIFFD